MINVKITSRSIEEDYVAVEQETGATALPGKHIFGIFSIGVISVLLALPFGSLIPEASSPFSALTAGREEQNLKFEEEYLQTNEMVAEANVEITQNAGSEENYDDDINTEALIAENADIKPENIQQTEDSDIQREKFTPVEIGKSSQRAAIAGQKMQEEAAHETESLAKSPETKVAINTEEKTEAVITEKQVNGKWYEQTIRRGDSLSKIFTYLNLKNDDLKKITAAAHDGDLNLSVGSKIQFLIDPKNTVQEIAIPIAGNKQVRFSRDIEKNIYTVSRERRFAQFSEIKSRGIDSATLMPSFVEAEKKRAQKKLEEEALLAQKMKLKEEQEKKQLEKALAAKSEKSGIKSGTETEFKTKYTAKNRPRLIIGTIQPHESFDKAAARLGLTRSEIVTIKNQYNGKVDFRRLLSGDSFRILFNGIGMGSSMTAIAVTSKKYGQVNLYRHPQNHIFYEENGYNPSSGAFRRFPITGQIKVSSPFNLHRYHPLRRTIRPHYGVDFKVGIGTPIYAPADGVVSYAKYMRGGGYTIIINHKGGYSTVYMHLSKFDVRQGEEVHIGQIIAKSGNTGTSTGAHLHYEVHVNGRPVDPLKVDLPSGSPAMAQRLQEAFKNNVYILKTELYKNKLAEIK